MSAVFPAATVLLLHEDPLGFRVMMLQRNRKVGFLPSAWVFPGGRVDPGDYDVPEGLIRGSAPWVERCGPEALASAVCALRETFEEAGVWLGTGPVTPQDRVDLASGALKFREILERPGVSLDLTRLAPWSRWITPVQESRRFDTRFFVARVELPEGSHDDGELVASGWFRPQDVAAVDPPDLAVNNVVPEAAFPMAPPTWWTVRELAAFQAVDEVVAAGWARPERPIEPILSMGDTVGVLLPGHAEHPEPRFPGLPTAVWLRGGRWEAEGL
jgi:8-oxo-dGTP pyrophosphatase MutT (NUDIX family)